MLGGGIGPAFWVALGAAALLGGYWLERAGVSGFYPRYYRLTEFLLALAAVCVVLVALLARGPEGPVAPAPEERLPGGPEPSGSEPDGAGPGAASRGAGDPAGPASGDLDGAGGP